MIKTLLAQIFVVRVKSTSFDEDDIINYVIDKIKEQPFSKDLTEQHIDFIKAAVFQYLQLFIPDNGSEEFAFKFVKDEDETLTDALYGHHVIPSLIIEYLLQNDFFEEIESKQFPVQVDEQDVRDLKRII